ncbi:MAG: DUF4136 domain-containing protein [Planctomycetota bacterium]
MPRIAVAALLLAACSSVQVSTDFDPGADFAALKTYAWLPRKAQPTGDPRLDSTLLHERIRSAVDAQLAERGYKKTAAGRADFHVAYHTAVERKMDVDTIYRGYGYGPDIGGWNAGHETVVFEYDQGTLLLDFLHPRSHRLLWRGSASAVVSESSTPEKRTKLINSAVAKLLDRFPPEQK